jgi:hypothetical protein
MELQTKLSSLLGKLSVAVKQLLCIVIAQLRFEIEFVSLGIGSALQ